MSRRHPLSFIFRITLHPWWRLTRGLTLGVRAAVVDEAGRVLLVRHRYYPGWHFPGGGVEREETTQAALARELVEETGIELMGEAELHGLFANFINFKSDHVAVYVVRKWQQGPWKPSLEIAEKKWVHPDALPDNVTGGTGRRIAEIFHGAFRADKW
ncbi:MAG: DNA mismatch repair protein MutT [Hyphomicrobiales bacterium]|nr:MAG: DNA mismatch repair protein MutT [Hyphomicrobiales bacterium]